MSSRLNGSRRLGRNRGLSRSCRLSGGRRRHRCCGLDGCRRGCRLNGSRRGCGLSGLDGCRGLSGSHRGCGLNGSCGIRLVIRRRLRSRRAFLVFHDSSPLRKRPRIHMSSLDHMRSIATNVDTKRHSPWNCRRIGERKRLALKEETGLRRRLIFRRASRIELPVAEINSPIHGKTGKVEEIHRQNPAYRAGAKLRSDAGNISCADKRKELPAGTRRRARLVAFERIHGPR